MLTYTEHINPQWPLQQVWKSIIRTEKKKNVVDRKMQSEHGGVRATRKSLRPIFGS
jgi:hypothetical protein